MHKLISTNIKLQDVIMFLDLIVFRHLHLAVEFVTVTRNGCQDPNFCCPLMYLFRKTVKIEMEISQLKIGRF
jgi:hypothetical protein